MIDFEVYTAVSQQIQAPEALKQQVLASIDAPAVPAARPPRRAKTAVRTLLIAAAVLAALTMTVFAAARILGLSDYLSSQGLGSEDALDALSTQPGEQTSLDNVPCLAWVRDDHAEYRVLEALADSRGVYLHMQIMPLEQDMLFIDQYLDGNSPAAWLGIPEITQGTVNDYAAGQHRRLRYASLDLQSPETLDFGTETKTAPDGSLHLYMKSSTPSPEASFTLDCVGFTYSVDGSDDVLSLPKTNLSFAVENKSTSTQGLSFTSFPEEIQQLYGVTIDRLALEKTELGYYYTFVYHGEQAEAVLFSMVDEQGQYFSVGGPSTPSSAQRLDDGSYRFTASSPDVPHPEKLMFMLIDQNFDKHGPYGFSP